MNGANIFLESFLLSLALSADALAVGLSYGANRVKVPLKSAILLGLIGSVVLAFSMLVGEFSQSVLPNWLAKYISFFILSALGLVKLANLESGGSFADCDNNKVLSLSEAVMLSAALSLDSLAAGFGVGISHADPILAILFTLILTTSALMAGAGFGKSLSHKVSTRHRYFGLILIVLAVTKII